MIKFLHVGDVHLGKSFATKDEVLQNKLQRYLKKSFDNAISFCIQHEVNALLIAGDLFDTNKLNIKEKQYIKEAFDVLDSKGIQVYYASGNHDYTPPGSDIRAIDFGPNVHSFFDAKWQMYELMDPDTKKIYKIVGCGHESEKEHRNLIETFPKGHYIGLAHSMVESSLTRGDEGQYLPSTIESISQKGYLYFALGHVHSRGVIDKNETIYYSGVLQGLNTNETGMKGGLLVTIEDDQMTVLPADLSELVYEQVSFDITSIESMDILFERMLEHLQMTFGESKNRIVTLHLVGRTPLYHTLKDLHEVENLESMLSERLNLVLIKIKNTCKSSYDASTYRHKKSVLGEVLKHLDLVKASDALPTLAYLLPSSQDLLREKLESMEDDILDYFLEGIDED